MKPRKTTGLVLAMALTALTPLTALPQAGMDRERLSRIPARMQHFVDEGVISGAVMLLARRGEVALLEAVGYQDVESQEPMRTGTIFQIQSMTKPVTAVGILILVEEGLLRLNDPVGMYLPEFRGQTLGRSAESDQRLEMQKPRRPITVRDLLTHTSGMPHGHHVYLTAPMVGTLQEAVASNAEQALESEPGVKFRYSSLGFETLGRLIEVVSGKPYEAFLRERIFHPLGMQDSFFMAAPDQRGRIASIYKLEDGRLLKLDRDPSRPFTYPNPAGGMFSTATDMFAFYQMTLDGGCSASGRILSRASVDAMTTPYVTVPPGGQISGFGLGWWVVREPVGTVGLPLQSNGAYGHAGYWGTIGWVDPKAGLVGVFLIHHRSDQLPRRAFAELFVTMATAAIAN